MQNYINSSLITQKQLINYVELKKIPFTAIQIKFAQTDILVEFQYFMEISKTLSNLFDCQSSDLHYEIFHNDDPYKEFTSSWKVNQKMNNSDGESENFILLDKQESIQMFIQYLKLKDQYVDFSIQFQESEFVLFRKQLEILKRIFKKDIQIKVIDKQGDNNDNRLNQMRRSYKERKKTQRQQQVNLKKDIRKYQDQLDTKENSLRLDHSSSLNSTLINFIENSNLNSLISKKNKIYQQFGSTFIGDQEFRQLFKKSYLCQSEYEIENNNDLIIFDSTMGTKIEIGSCTSNIYLKQAVVNLQYKKYYQEMVGSKNVIKIYYIDLIGKSFTEFSRNIVYYNNFEVALNKFKECTDSYLIQFETCSEFEIIQMSNYQVKLQQDNKVMPLIIITNQN